MSAHDRKQLLASYASAPARLQKVLQSVPNQVWRYKPAPAEWSIHEIVLHLADAETNMYVRARCAIAEPGSRVMAFGQDRWAETLRYEAQDARLALELIRVIRELTSALLEGLPESVWANTIEHSEYGVMTLEQWLERAVKHANDHIQQIEGNLARWRQQAR